MTAIGGDFNGAVGESDAQLILVINWFEELRQRMGGN